MIYKKICLRDLKYEHLNKNCMLIITILIIRIISIAILLQLILFR